MPEAIALQSVPELQIIQQCSLYLRVDNERPSIGVGEDDGVLGGHAVGREALVVPAGDRRVVRQELDGVQVVRDGDHGLQVGGMIMSFSCEKQNQQMTASRKRRISNV